MALVHHHRAHWDDAWLNVIHRVATICLIVAAAAALYFAFGTTNTAPVESSMPLLPLPPLLPIIPIL